MTTVLCEIDLLIILKNAKGFEDSMSHPPVPKTTPKMKVGGLSAIQSLQKSRVPVDQAQVEVIRACSELLILLVVFLVDRFHDSKDKITFTLVVVQDIFGCCA